MGTLENLKKVWDAIERGDDAIKVMAMISEARLDVNFRTRGMFLLNHAVWHKRDKLVQLLLECPNIDVNDREPFGTSPLSAAIHGVYRYSKCMNSIDAQEDPVYVEQYTELCRPHYEANVRMAKMLLKRDDINSYGGLQNLFDSESWKGILQNPHLIPDELLILMKKHAKEQFKKSQLKKLWEKIIPGEAGVVEMNLAPFLLRKMPEPKSTSGSQ